MNSSRSDNDGGIIRDAGPVQYRLGPSAIPQEKSPAPVIPNSTRSGGNTRRPTDHVHVRAYSAPNWFTTEGVRAKRRQLESRGLPRMKYWRFITLTLDRHKFHGDPVAGYLAGKSRMRNFLVAARDAGLWKSSHRWAWKLEFQEDGWAHWHLLVGRKKKFSHDELASISELWGLGWTHVRMIDEDAAKGYPFKYAFKPVSQESDNSDPETAGNDFAVPAWFLDYIGGGKSEGDQLKTFQRVRFWQTGKGFYTTDKDALPEDDEEGENEDPPEDRCPFPWTAREVLERRQQSVQIVSRRSSGRYLASAVILLSVSAEFFWGLVGYQVLHGDAVGLACNSYIVPASIIERNTTKTCKLQQLLTKNRLTLRRAQKLATQGETLRTC